MWKHHRKTPIEITSGQRHREKIGFQKGIDHQQDENREASGNRRAVRVSEQWLILESERLVYRPDQWKGGEERDKK